MSGRDVIPDAFFTDSRLDPECLPEALKRIWYQAQSFQAGTRERMETASEWVKQVKKIQSSVPSVCVEDDGETVRLGDLSPGCVACKAGKMDCIFVTTRCNLNCAFCMTPRSLAIRPMYSAFGGDLATLCARYATGGVSGVAFSGGEPFLDPESVLEWISVLRREFPALYIWAETNGLLLSSILLRRLADAGLNEIRFNMAATGYFHALANRMLYEAVRYIPSVAVELPTLPEHTEAVLGCLHAWSDGGVKYLNLHELVYEVESHSENLEGARSPLTMPDGHHCAVNPHSSELVRAVLDRVATDHLPLAVNDCSLRNKARQMRGRRRLLAPLTLQLHEQLREDGLAESACLFDADHVEFVHPMALNEQRCLRKGCQTARLRRHLPLNLEHEGQWVDFDIMGKDPIRA